MVKKHTTMFKLTGCALMVMMLSCNLAPPAENEHISSVSLQGSWQDHLDSHTIYFGGTTHTLAFESDSFFLKVFQFSDVMIPFDTCYSPWYTQYVKGTFSIGLQDSITLDGVYVDSLKRALPDCECHYGPRQTGRYLVSFKGALDGNVLYLTTLPSSGASDWVLTNE
jgi:hypothetical protein